MDWKRWIMVLVTMLLPWAAMAQTPTYPVNDFFDWVEKTFPATFPKALAAGDVNYQGCVYDYRYYGIVENKEYYLGVCRTDGIIRSLLGTVLQAHGSMEQYKCQATTLCGAPTFAGTITLAGDGHYIGANYKDGKMWGLGADNQGFEIPVGKIQEVCFHSNRLNNWGKKGVLGCNKPEANGTLKITGVPNNDCGRYTVWSEDKEYWLDLGTATGYKFTGQNAKLNSTCGIEYGEKGFRPNRLSAVQEADGTASVVLDFGSNYLGGFALNGQAVVLDPSKPLVFALHGDHAGKDFGPGWGIGENKDKDGNIIPPSIRWGWPEYKDDRFVVTFKNVPCSNRGSITVYTGSGPANNVVYDKGPNGFGLGWISLPGPDGVSVWNQGDKVAFHRENYQFSHGIPFCKQ